jgi:hypothetical protein
MDELKAALLGTGYPLSVDRRKIHSAQEIRRDQFHQHYRE